MIAHLFFYVGLAFFIVHKLDAVRCKEWRIMPLLAMLEDDLGYIVFLMIHVSAFFILLSQLTPGHDVETFIKGFDVFMMVHVAFHLVFVQHPNNRFNNWISWAIILSAAIMGLTDLMVK